MGKPTKQIAAEEGTAAAAVEAAGKPLLRRRRHYCSAQQLSRLAAGLWILSPAVGLVNGFTCLGWPNLLFFSQDMTTLFVDFSLGVLLLFAVCRAAREERPRPRPLFVWLCLHWFRVGLAVSFMMLKAATGKAGEVEYLVWTVEIVVAVGLWCLLLYYYQVLKRLRQKRDEAWL